MPSLSPTMSEGSIVQWCKKEGDSVQSGDVLCEVQTDKAVVALECEEDGVLAKILVAEKSPNVLVGSMIAVVAGTDENWEEVAKAVPSSQQPVKEQASQTQPIPSDAEPSKPSGSSKRSPAARLLIQTHGLDSSQIPASGPKGTLLKEDVLGYLQTHPNTGSAAQTVKVTPSAAPDLRAPTPPVPTALFVDIPLSNMRQTIAKRLTMSKTSIPHAYVRSTAPLDRVMELRRLVASQMGIKVSVNDIIIKACALGLRLVPDLNATFDASTGGGRLTIQPSVDICMAVATPAGLITPILPGVDRMPISQLSLMATSLAKRARDGKLQPHEFQGGSFTISNLGMFGIREFTAIINPPQVAILAVGSGLPMAVATTTADGSQAARFASTLTLTLSVDSRNVTEATAGRFLAQVSRILSDHPQLLFADDPDVDAMLNGRVATRDPFDVSLLSAMNSRSPVKSAVV